MPGRAAAEEQDLSSGPHELGKQLPDGLVARAVHGDVGGAALADEASGPWRVRSTNRAPNRAARPARSGRRPAIDDLEAAARRDGAHRNAERAGAVDEQRARGRAQPVPAVEDRGERIEEGRDLVVEALRNAVEVRGDDARGHPDVLGEGAPHPVRVAGGAEVRRGPPRQSAQRPQGPETPGTTRSPTFQPRHALADLDDLAAELVAHRHAAGAMRAWPRARSFRSVPQVSAARMRRTTSPGPGGGARCLPRVRSRSPVWTNAFTTCARR